MAAAALTTLVTLRPSSVAAAGPPPESGDSDAPSDPPTGPQWVDDGTSGPADAEAVSPNGEERSSPEPGQTRAAAAPPQDQVAAPPKTQPSAEPVDAPQSEPLADPNDAPRMRAPLGQPRTDEHRWSPPFAASDGRSRRVAITLQPMFAAWRIGFIGRPSVPFRGAGAIAELDVRVWRTLWLRASASYSAHPVESIFARDDDDAIVQTAASGVLQSTGVALGAAYAFDLGRFLPLLEIGLGGMFISMPEGVIDGQKNGECRSDGTCDAGLRCGADNVCQTGVLPTLHGGIGFDIMLTRHVSAGAGIRYYAVATAPGAFPIYLTGSGRLGLRW